MAKYELVKETRPNGTILYSVELNGRYVSHTATEDLAQAKEFFSLLTTKVNNTETIKETIQTIELDEN
jgi:hypothetical protein